MINTIEFINSAAIAAMAYGGRKAWLYPSQYRLASYIASAMKGSATSD